MVSSCVLAGCGFNLSTWLQVRPESHLQSPHGKVHPLPDPMLHSKPPWEIQREERAKALLKLQSALQREAHPCGRPTRSRTEERPRRAVSTRGSRGALMQRRAHAERSQVGVDAGTGGHRCWGSPPSSARLHLLPTGGAQQNRTSRCCWWGEIETI